MSIQTNSPSTNLGTSVSADEMPIKATAKFSRITTDQTGLSGSYAENTVQFNSEGQDTDDEWENSSGVLTYSGSGGRFLVISTVYFSSSNDQFAILYQNSTEKDYAYQGNAAASTRKLSQILDISTNDTLTVKVGASSAPTVVKARTTISIIRLGRSS